MTPTASTEAGGGDLRGSRDAVPTSRAPLRSHPAWRSCGRRPSARRARRRGSASRCPARTPRASSGRPAPRAPCAPRRPAARSRGARPAVVLEETGEELPLDVGPGRVEGSRRRDLAFTTETRDATRATSSRWWLETSTPAPAPHALEQRLAQQHHAGGVERVGRLVEHHEHGIGAAAPAASPRRCALPEDSVREAASRRTARGRARAAPRRRRRRTSSRSSPVQPSSRQQVRADGQLAVRQRALDEVTHARPRRRARLGDGARRPPRPRPTDGTSIPSASRINVDFPAPLSPTRAWISPGDHVEVDVADAGPAGELARDARRASSGVLIAHPQDVQRARATGATRRRGGLRSSPAQRSSPSVTPLSTAAAATRASRSGALVRSQRSLARHRRCSRCRPCSGPPATASRRRCAAGGASDQSSAAARRSTAKGARRPWPPARARQRARIRRPTAAAISGSYGSSSSRDACSGSAGRRSSRSPRRPRPPRRPWSRRTRCPLEEVEGGVEQCRSGALGTGCHDTNVSD